jgi:hypothetical protein
VKKIYPQITQITQRKGKPQKGTEGTNSIHHLIGKTDIIGLTKTASTLALLVPFPG